MIVNTSEEGDGLDRFERACGQVDEVISQIKKSNVREIGTVLVKLTVVATELCEAMEDVVTKIRAISDIPIVELRLNKVAARIHSLLERGEEKLCLAGLSLCPDGTRSISRSERREGRIADALCSIGYRFGDALTAEAGGVVGNLYRQRAVQVWLKACRINRERHAEQTWKVYAKKLHQLDPNVRVGKSSHCIIVLTIIVLAVGAGFAFLKMK